MDETFTNLIGILNKLYGLPAVVLVAISCIVWGYALRFVKKFDNKSIPLAVLGWGAFWLPLLSEYKPGQMRLQIVRNVFVGFIAAFAAWMVHDKLLKGLEDKLGWFQDKPDSPAVPPTTTTKPNP